ncbi:MAG TPA: LacI family DNA-binding transcriptional regulator [Phototrophicaceae bacterium]|jgi:LacI family transcriptional regulator|nr:LacI family DNA-binding transcriptional regulator [Phototrophicaceae bacterium]
MAKRQQRVTLEDVAHEAGVSMMTVSRVINHTGRISEQTRQHVFEVIERLGYRPNRAARTLVTNQTFMVAFVVPDITNPYFSEIFQGVEDVLRHENYHVLVANSNEIPAREKDVLERLDDTTIDGLIICSSRLTDDDLIPLIEKFSSVVTVTRPLPKHLASGVISDYTPGHRALLGLKHLHDNGYRKIGYIRLRHHDMFVDMVEFQRELNAIGIDFRTEWTIACDPKWQAGYDAAYRMLQQYPELEAIAGGNDLVALGAMRAALDLGRKIPDNLAIIGADDILLASQVSPPLTTLRINSYENGTIAAELLLLRMAGDTSYREHIYGADLMVRGTTRKLAPHEIQSSRS